MEAAGGVIPVFGLSILAIFSTLLVAVVHGCCWYGFPPSEALALSAIVFYLDWRLGNVGTALGQALGKLPETTP